MALTAAIDGVGLAFVMEDEAAHAVEDGRLVAVTEEWCPSFAGYHLYYPDRCQLPPTFALLVQALRYRA